MTLEKKLDRPRKNGENSMMRKAVTNCAKSTSCAKPGKKVLTNHGARMYAMTDTDSYCGKKNRKDRVDEFPAVFLALIEIADKERNENGSRNSRSNGRIDQIWNAKCGIKQVQRMACSKHERQNPVANEAKDLRSQSENRKKYAASWRPRISLPRVAKNFLTMKG